MTGEARLERKCKKYAEGKGCMLLKWRGHSQRGVPDRILMVQGAVVFIEFKAPGGDPYAKLSRQQRVVLDKLWALNLNAYAVSEFDRFVEIVEKYSYA